MTNEEIETACFGAVLEKKEPWQQQALEILGQMNANPIQRHFLNEAIGMVKSAALLKSVQTPQGTFDEAKLKAAATALSDAYRNQDKKGI